MMKEAVQEAEHSIQEAVWRIRLWSRFMQKGIWDAHRAGGGSGHTQKQAAHLEVRVS